MLPRQRTQRDQGRAGGLPDLCASANPTEVIVAETAQGRGIVGVVDGFGPLGVENDDDIRWRKDLLRTIGYKA